VVGADAAGYVPPQLHPVVGNGGGQAQQADKKDASYIFGTGSM
jgi:hypothetical protein